MNRIIINDLIKAKELWPEIDNKNSQDLTGKKYNYLTGVYRTNNDNNNVSWVWQCDCGNYIKTRSSSVKQGRIKSCGCIQNHTTLIDLTGQKIGKWTVLKRAPNKNKAVYWLCQCECGTIREVKAASLRTKRSQSCGCRQKELNIINSYKLKGKTIKDLKGQQFGDLIVLNYVNSNNNGNAVWNCQCSCGKQINVASPLLVRHKKTNCGCKSTISRGENKIKEILLKNNLNFIQQASTELRCKYPETNTSARFDFYVKNSYIIEYDGETHFKENIGNGWISEEKYLYTKTHDDFKNQWCKDNNIPLIRIPYTHYNDLCLEDLLPETSKFLIN